METIHDVCREMGERHYTNEHVFAWLSRALASDAVNVRCEFPLGPNADGEYTVVLKASAV